MNRGLARARPLHCVAMVDRALRLVFRNYWTIFFVVASVTVPLQVAYASVWHNVIAVRELHDDIAEFPPLRQVHGVGREQLRESRIAFWAIVAAELALIPLFVRATSRVLEVDGEKGVPSAVDAWRSALSRGRRRTTARALARPGPLITGALLALAVGALVQAAGRLLVEPLSDDRAFVGVGLVDGVARAAGAPFFLVVAALAVIGAARSSSLQPSI
jgi:hypothetical protein